MAISKTYNVTLVGESPLLMHKDNLAFSEKIKAWQKNPDNKAQSVAGDDRTPPWAWLSCLYDDGNFIGVDSDLIMSTLREGGAKLPTGKGKETYKRQTQSQVMCDQILWPIVVNGKKIPIEPFNKCFEMDFADSMELAEKYGFDLFVKRAKIGRSKHVRVRPRFKEGWTASGTLTVLDEELSGITQDILKRILELAGKFCGLGDWRPLSPMSPGTFGRFGVEITPM